MESACSGFVVVKLNRDGLHRGEDTEVEALQQNIARRVVARIVPDYANGCVRVTDSDARKVVHGEAAVTWDRSPVHGHNVDRVGDGSACGAAGRARKQNARRSRYIGHLLLHLQRTSEKIGCPVELVGDVNVSRRWVHGQVSPFNLRTASRSCDGHITSDRNAGRVTYWRSWVSTERAVPNVADRQGDGVAGGEVCVAGVEQAPRRVDGQEVF